MYLFENAFRNVLRNKGRNLLIGVMIFAVIVTTVITLMISTTADSIIDDYKSRFSTEVQLSPNMEKVREAAMANRQESGPIRITSPALTAEEYILYGQSDSLARSIYTAQTGVNSDTLTAIDADKGPGSGMMGGVVRINGGGGGNNSSSMPQYYYKMIGGEFNGTHSDFDDGTRTLAEGEFPNELNECLISEELASANEIKIGDTLTLTGELFQMGDLSSDNPQPDISTQEISYSLTVTGTYYDLTDPYTEGMMENAFANRRNEILTTYETVQQNFIPDYQGMMINATYYLKEPSLLEAYEAECRAKGLSDLFNVSTDTATYDRIVGPVEGLKSISVTFMVVVLIFGGIIIALLASIAIRERKYEIGVLRAMGMKKHKVAFGLWTEMLIITAVCLIIGLGVGSLAAQPVTDTLLSQQVEAATSSQDTGGPGGPGASGGTIRSGNMFMGPNSSISGAEPLSELNVALSINTVTQIIGIALLLATFAALIAITRITKYEPIKILMERN